MIDIAPFTDEQWYKMCDCNLGLPAPLAQADISKPFIYDRKYGLFYCPGGFHQAGMSLLLAFHHGLNSGIEVAEKLKLYYSHDTADHYLEKIPGTAFKSSVGKCVYAGKRTGLNVFERTVFGNVEYLFENELNDF